MSDDETGLSTTDAIISSTATTPSTAATTLTTLTSTLLPRPGSLVSTVLPWRIRNKHRIMDLSSSSSSYVQCLPTVFLAGFPKCGTTDLYQKLLQHPQIVAGKHKEPHFWSGKRE